MSSADPRTRSTSSLRGTQSVAAHLVLLHLLSLRYFATPLPCRDAGFLDGTRTTAEVRPNAYIPEGAGIGLPKPYGEFAPFKPQVAGASMRHFRVPEAKEIEL